MNTNHEKLFKNPTSEYRGAPFWAWNTKITKDILNKQLPVFKEMGFGGYHVHPRTGLDTEYLSDEFMEMVRFCAEFARANGMKCYGYDEDRFPSGAAGGIVTKKIEYRQRQLVWTKKFDETIMTDRPKERAVENYYIGKYVIKQDEEGFIVDYKRVKINENTDYENVRYALVRIASPETWFNNQTYVDTMYKPAVDEFIKTTHQRYYDELGEYFGEIIPSFFTDEPKVAYKKVLENPWDENDIVLPWTDDFQDTFLELYNFDIVNHIPELYLETKAIVSKARYFYHRHIMERFCEAFSDNIGKWCDEHNLSLSGHMVKEPKLSSQSVSAGEVMSPLSAFGIPGIDMLCDAREYTTAKQAQSIKDQYGRKFMLSELYGVTNWDFDFRGHKLGGDWQAALGVNLRVPHLAWMSMKGESKRDYPASIFYQSPWYKKYKIIEDHFARINTAMNLGKRKVSVAMIHPVESCWNHWGVKSQTKETLKSMDNGFKFVTERLLFETIDFDYISESLLPKQFCGINDNNEIKVGKMSYKTIIIPDCESLRKSTKDILDNWVLAGGEVIVLNKYPKIMEGKAVDARIFYNYDLVENMDELINCLSRFKQIEVKDSNNNPVSRYIVQSKEDGDDFWVFMANAKRTDENSMQSQLEITVQHEGIPYLFDTLSGKIYRLENLSKNSNLTVVKLHVAKHDSILLCISKDDEKVVDLSDVLSYDEVVEFPKKVQVSLSEENCYILDIARYYLNDDIDNLSKPEEILRIGQKAREALNIPLDGAKMAQPWTKVKRTHNNTITLQYCFKSKVDLDGVKLALEDADVSDICFNKVKLVKEKCGYFADEAIEKLLLPPVKKGENIIEITLPIGDGTDIEACYLLGDFSVYKDEEGYYLDEPVTNLSFGSVVDQGLPFYGGNIIYHIEDAYAGYDKSICVEEYKGSLISVDVNGDFCGDIIFDPYEICIEKNQNLKQEISLTLYGNRNNTFGPVHNRLQPLKWGGPEAFRTRDFFTYDYVLKDFGIMKTPKMRIRKGN